MSEFRQLLNLGKKSKCTGIDASPSVCMAYGLLFKGNRSGAELRFQRILKDNPEDVDALAGLAVCVAEGTGRYVSATKLATESVRRNPHSPAGYYALAYIHLLGSRLEQGYRYLMKAKKLAPRDPRLESGFELFERERPPVLPDLSRDHPVNVVLTGARSFMRTSMHRTLVGCLVLESVYLTGSLLG
jgi:tetratricopeptide (TPR) repeat protein